MVPFVSVTILYSAPFAGLSPDALVQSRIRSEMTDSGVHVDVSPPGAMKERFMGVSNITLCNLDCYNETKKIRAHGRIPTALAPAGSPEPLAAADLTR